MSEALTIGRMTEVLQWQTNLTAIEEKILAYDGSRKSTGRPANA
jgi:hypothetical protein